MCGHGCRKSESCLLIGLNTKANGIKRDSGCGRYVTGAVWGKFKRKYGGGGEVASAEGV